MSAPVHGPDAIPRSGDCAGTTFGIDRTRMGPPASEPRRTTVYRFFAFDGQLLYVGATVHPGVRLGAHHKKPWWSCVQRVEFAHFPSHREALREEARAIRDEQPLYNVRGRLSNQ